ncbi:MAG: ribonuclease R [Clostridia bacterium]|nr:ribonuclease R [Clostridia bacterium]
MILIETKQKLVLDLINDKDYTPMKFNDIAAILNVPKEDIYILSKVLDTLVFEGEITKERDGKYRSVSNEGLIFGTFSGSKKGYGFIRPKDKNIPDIFISAENTCYAMNNDEVFVKITKQAENDSSAEGKVVKIAKRANNTLVGTVQVNRNIVFVIPDDKKIGSDIFISNKNSKKYKSGQKAVVKITKWPDRFKGAAGDIIEILGYADEVGVDVMSVIRNHHIKDFFDKKTLQQADTLKVSDNDFKSRTDLTDILTITIDGEDAKDLDDAISLEIKDGFYQLGVHIADVSHFVTEDSYIDKEALKRGTSVYFADRVIPMLPVKLSNGLCSLNPDEKKLALSVMMKIDKKGNVTEYEVIKSVILSDYRMTYSDVTKILDGDKKLCDKYKKIVPMLYDMDCLKDILHAKRLARGSVNFDFPEAKILFDESGLVADVVKREFTRANSIIEEFMLICNETVAEHMFWAELPCVYRVHETPDSSKIENFKKMLSALGYSMKNSKELHSAEFNKILAQIEGKPEERILSTLMLRSFMKARYSPENLGHFGLASKYYCHFTSPIRRYPDLVVHRILKESLDGFLSEKRQSKLAGFTQKASLMSSDAEITAMEAEREVEAMKKAEFMANFIGEDFEGTVSSVTGFGIFVELDNTIEGLIRYADITSDYFEFDPETLTAYGKTSGSKYKIGQKVTVCVVASNPLTGEIDFMI